LVCSAAASVGRRSHLAVKTFAIVVAAGRSARMGGAGGKGFLAIGGQLMAIYSLTTPDDWEWAESYARTQQAE